MLSNPIHRLEIYVYDTEAIKQEGDDPDQPYVIKAAFTGCAASNIKGRVATNRETETSGLTSIH